MYDVCCPGCTNEIDQVGWKEVANELNKVNGPTPQNYFDDCYIKYSVSSNKKNNK